MTSANRLRFGTACLLAALACLSACTSDTGESTDPTDDEVVLADEGVGQAEDALSPGCSSPSVACGMTWVKVGHDGSKGQDTVSCHDHSVTPNESCDAYVGDTNCTIYRPILCIHKDNSASNGFSGSFYNGWAAGNINITRPIQGTQLTSQAVADGICASQFGVGWQMAEFHDGNGGWSWTSYGNLNDLYNDTDGSHTLHHRFWVRISDQPANCWN